MTSLISNSTYIASPLAREVITEARQKKHYEFRVVGDQGPLPAPMYQNNFIYSPLAELKITNPIIQKKAIQRVNFVRSMAPVRQYIIAEEDPSEVLGPLKKTQPLPQPWRDIPLKIRKIKEMPEIYIDWQTVGQVALATAKVAGMVALATVYVLAALASALIGLDPKLIVVLEDGTWLEVATWRA